MKEDEFDNLNFSPSSINDLNDLNSNDQGFDSESISPNVKRKPLQFNHSFNPECFKNIFEEYLFQSNSFNPENKIFPITENNNQLYDEYSSKKENIPADLLNLVEIKRIQIPTLMIQL